MAGISNTKTPLVFAIEDELYVLIEEADAANEKKPTNILCCKTNEIFASNAGAQPMKTINETWPNFTPC